MSTTYLFPSTLKGLADVSVSPGAEQSGYPLTWNNTTGKWEASFNIAGVTIRAGAGTSSQALGSTANSSGIYWVAQGFEAGRDNTSGSYWIAQGYRTGAQNQSGVSWIAQGINAGQQNTLGSYWVAQGTSAGLNNTIGFFWVAQSLDAGQQNTVGSSWIAQGASAGQSNITESSWIAQGVAAGLFNTAGSRWVAQGANAGLNNTAGSFWVAQGFEAGFYDTRSNVLNIANARSKSLICGDFSSDCIYFGHAGPITSSATVPTPTAAVHAAASNTTRASLRIDSGVAPTSPFTGDAWINTSNNSLNFQVPLVNLQGTQVLATRRTGWTTPTGTATRTAFDTSTATTQQLAERLKALIDDLITHGLIGA